ncbi:uncharacterized protein BXZ73DRAFT_89249 [Epithele typhae]|uniref:uncharacterized protein n=1 Tax=Epithele typhae TaxID=378194 RepID=UPI0020072B97|nr:uncharacterized protein BXZ73DRAFT_89249 [Epithele typhae]KAH9937829.1 hypothetical protein BXZ73DRAFT_89249 [Epithele typhae]
MNRGQARLAYWWKASSGTKSNEDFNDLIHVLSSTGFDDRPITEGGFSAEKDATGIFSGDDGWNEKCLETPLPKTHTPFRDEASHPTFPVPGFRFRRLLSLLKAAVMDETTEYVNQHHWIPHELYWRPDHVASTPADPQPPPIRIFTDIFNSDEMLKEAETLRTMARNPADPADLEYAVLPLLIWSDATQLSNFGSASLWPIYVYLGNVSKYVRARPTSFAAHHLAYIPDLPDSFKEYYTNLYGRPPSSDVLKFCKRELFQQVWLALMDDDFMTAYEHGFVVTCGDGVTRRMFPRFLTYSADYPEKILGTALRPLAKCPCTRCLVCKEDIADSGLPTDMSNRETKKRVDDSNVQDAIAAARRAVFKGRSLAGKYVKVHLDDRSLNPIRVSTTCCTINCSSTGSFQFIQSAFSERLASFGFNVYDLFAPDLMHEFELGVWKGTFQHLMRLLDSDTRGGDSLASFNSRMRLMPTFGSGRIRRFWHDASSRKRLAARDYEAYLLTIMPAFDGLLADNNDNHIVSNMLFELANWHALAKLRLQTDITIDIMATSTLHMYASVRKFADTTCTRHTTYETGAEAETRVRRETAQPHRKSRPADTRRKRKDFSVNKTYKYHALGHCVAYIRRRGPLDVYSTQTGELEHRHVKRFYSRTNKVRYIPQLASQTRRAALLQKIKHRDVGFVPRRELAYHQKRAATMLQESSERLSTAPMHGVNGSVPEGDNDATDSVGCDPHAKYNVGQSRNDSVKIFNWLASNRTDPAIVDFLPALRRHCFARLFSSDRTALEERPLNPAETIGLHIHDTRIYRHKVIRFNYSTYDMRRDQDSVNPRTHSDVMVWAPDTDAIVADTPHLQYSYARVIDIFHVYVSYVGPGSTAYTQRSHRLDVLRVRWFEHDPTYQSGFAHRRLPRVKFVPHEDPTAFGFLDPACVIRASYLLPAFDMGRTQELLPPSPLARVTSGDKDDEDFAGFHVCMFVDRDMYMRYLGGGVGHREEFITVEQSRMHALRAEADHDKDIGVVGGSEHIRLDEDDDACDEEDEEMECSDESHSDEEYDLEDLDDADDDDENHMLEDLDDYEDNVYEIEGFARP